MEHPQNHIRMTWPYHIKIVALIIVCLCFFVSVAKASDDNKARQLLDNVVSIVTEIGTQDNSKIEEGFGFIVAERNAKFIIVTASHVIDGRSLTPNEERKNIQVSYHKDPGHEYQAERLKSFKNKYGVDIAVIEAKKPSHVKWDTNALDNSKNIKRGTEVWYIGRSGDWVVPPTPGKIMDKPILGKFFIEGISIRPGTSGAPVVSAKGIIGMITKASPNFESQAISIDTIQMLLSREKFPWLLVEASSKDESEPTSTGRLYVKTNPANASVKLINSNLKFHQGIGLAPGEYRIEVSAAGYEKKSVGVTITTADDKKIDVRLKRSLYVESKRYIFGGGPAGGTFQEFAKGVQTYKPIKTLTGLTVMAQSSGGSFENLRKTNSGRAQMSLVYSSHLWLGLNGKLKNDPKKYDSVLAIAWLYSAPAQLVVKKHSGIRSVRDLAGKKVGVGNSGSMAYAHCEQFFSHMGVWNRIERNAMGYNDSAAAFSNNQLDAFWLFTAFPSGAVVMAAQRSNIELINLINDAESSGFLESYPCFTRINIPAGTYSGVNRDTPTFQDSVLWVANARVPEAAVYNLLSILYSHDGLRHMWSQKKTFKNMRLETGADNIVTPLHPGAKQFWKEKGVRHY